MSIDITKAIEDMREVINFKDPAPYSGVTGTILLCASLKACIERWAPPGSSYGRMASAIDPFTSNADYPEQKLRGILLALKQDYAAGKVAGFEELVHGAVFDDLLQQADYLLAEGFLLPSAVVAGATLEEHLRQLAPRHALALLNVKGKPKAASELNDDLKVAYGQPQWRQVQVWIDLRNEAAHGKPEFAKRTKADIKPMLDGIREFITRYPA